MGRFRGKWKYAERAINVAQVVAIFAAAGGLYYNARQIELSSNLASAEIGLRFDDRMYKANMIGIRDAISSTPPHPILVAHTGNFSEDDLDQFLGNFDTLYYIHKESLINDVILYDVFCGDLEDAFQDAEVTQYLKEQRKIPGNTSDDVGFDKLAQICLTWEKTGMGKHLED